MKALKVFAIVVVLLAIIVWGVNFIFSPGDKVALPEYSVGSTSEYIRDGALCIAYRVSTKEALDDLSDKQLEAVYNDTIKGDDYYLHTVWFYDEEHYAVIGGVYDAQVEEVSYRELAIDRR